MLLLGRCQFSFGFRRPRLGTGSGHSPLGSWFTGCLRAVPCEVLRRWRLMSLGVTGRVDCQAQHQLSPGNVDSASGSGRWHLGRWFVGQRRGLSCEALQRWTFRCVSEAIRTVGFFLQQGVVRRRRRKEKSRRKKRRRTKRMSGQRWKGVGFL